MARYGKGGLSTKIGMTDYELKTGMAAHGLKGVEGNKAITHRAQQMAEDRDMSTDEVQKGHYLWDLAQRDLIKRGNEGGDPHGEYRDYKQQSEIDELHSRLKDQDLPDEPEEAAAPTVSGTSRANTTDSARLAEAKERSSNFKDTYSAPFDQAEAEVEDEDASEKAAASFMSDYSLDLQDKMKNGTFNA